MYTHTRENNKQKHIMPACCKACQKNKQKARKKDVKTKKSALRSRAPHVYRMNNQPPPDLLTKPRPAFPFH